MANENEAHPNWAGKLDWLGVQYYARFGVTGAIPAIPAIQGLPCVEGLPLTGGCLVVEDPTKCVPDMGYEYYEPGVYKILKDFVPIPELPMTVTESNATAFDALNILFGHSNRSPEPAMKALTFGDITTGA